jgi:PAS domain S-box-containing protein
MENTTKAEHDARGPEAGWAPDVETLRLMGDLADLAWFQVDGERNVVALSPAMEKLTGITAEQAVGRPCIYLSRCHECLRHCGVFEQGVVKQHHLTLYGHLGEEIPVSKSGQVLLDEDGTIVGAVEFVHPRSGNGIDECADDQDLAGEANRIAQALKDTRYNRTEAAKQLGISRTTLWRKMREYGL